MKRARAFGVWGASVVLAASFVYACSSSSTDGGGGSTTGDKDATTGSQEDSGGYSSTGDSGGLGNLDSGTLPKRDAGSDASTGPCGTSASTGACYQCCDTFSDGGVTEFFTLQDTCICNTKKCGTAAKCKNTYCKDPSVTDAGVKCNTCIDEVLGPDAGDAGCSDSTFNQCGADPACAQGITCVIDSNCDSIP